MLVYSDLQGDINEYVFREIQRLQQLSPGIDILQSSGQTVANISEMISGIVKKHLGGSVKYEYNIPWMTQVLLKRGSTQKDLRIDDPNQIFYKTNPSIHLPIVGKYPIDAILSMIPDRCIFDWYVQNMTQVIEVLQSLRDTISKKKDIMILSNHATWFNLPLIAHCLHRIFKIPQENLYAIIGPAITHSEWSLAGILRYSNVLKTYPDTEKAVSGYSGISGIRKKFSIRVHRVFYLENQTGYSRVLIVAPSGTTDKIGIDGHLSMRQPSEGTKRLIAGLIKDRGLSGFVTGVNDIEIIPPGCSRPKKGNVYVGVQGVDSDNWEDIMPSCILDKHGNPIGKWNKTKPST